jgi:uncharacterized protein (TIGR02246 family)
LIDPKILSGIMLEGHPMAEDRDATAIEQTLRTLQIAFLSRNADLLRDVYVADADWTNAFGTTRSGRDSIVAYLRGLFADEHFGAGQLVGAPQISVRPVSPDVVVARTYVEIAGQQAVDGKELSTRRNHSLKVLVRQEDGRWLIVSEMYMDAREETTYVASC